MTTVMRRAEARASASTMIKSSIKWSFTGGLGRLNDEKYRGREDIFQNAHLQFACSEKWPDIGFADIGHVQTLTDFFGQYGRFALPVKTLMAVIPSP